MLWEDPSAVAALQVLIAVHNAIGGGEFQQMVIQAGTIHGGVHQG
ncbi:hypothetical protein [Streptomyces sp. NPDC058653]